MSNVNRNDLNEKLLIAIQGTKNENNKIKSEILSLEQKNSEIEKLIEDSQLRLAYLKSKDSNYKTLQTQIDTLHERISFTEEEIDNQNEELLKYKDLMRETVVRISTNHNKRKSLQEKLDQLSFRIIQLTKQAKQFEPTEQDIQESEKLQRYIAEKEAFYSEEINKLQNKAEELKTKISSMEGDFNVDLSTRGDLIEELNNKIAEKDRIIDDLIKDEKKLIQKNIEIEAEMSQKDDLKSALTSKLKKGKEKVQKWKNIFKTHYDAFCAEEDETKGLEEKLQCAKAGIIEKLASVEKEEDEKNSIDLQLKKAQFLEKQKILDDYTAKMKAVEAENSQLIKEIQNEQENMKSNELKFTQKKNSLLSVIEVIKTSLKELNK